jgi:hypothetical protein
MTIQRIDFDCGENDELDVTRPLGPKIMGVVDSYIKGESDIRDISSLDVVELKELLGFLVRLSERLDEGEKVEDINESTGWIFVDIMSAISPPQISTEILKKLSDVLSGSFFLKSQKCFENYRYENEEMPISAMADRKKNLLDARALSELLIEVEKELTVRGYSKPVPAMYLFAKVRSKIDEVLEKTFRSK